MADTVTCIIYENHMKEFNTAAAGIPSKHYIVDLYESERDKEE